MKLHYLVPLTLTYLYCHAMHYLQETRIPTLSDGKVDRCGAADWQRTNLEKDGSAITVDAPDPGKVKPMTASPLEEKTTKAYDHILDSDTSDVGTTGHWKCRSKPVPVKDDGFATASYKRGGRMASVYHPESKFFRCDIQPPENGFYVAVWTRYNANLESQPRPRNCNEWLLLKNPRTNHTARALIIDRCASCVGVDHQTSDPDVLDSLVNGATIDLSPELWKELYNDAPDGIYDVDYDGPIYGGSLDGPPDALLSPKCDHLEETT